MHSSLNVKLTIGCPRRLDCASFENHLNEAILDFEIVLKVVVPAEQNFQLPNGCERGYQVVGKMTLLCLVAESSD